MSFQRRHLLLEGDVLLEKDISFPSNLILEGDILLEGHLLLEGNVLLEGYLLTSPSGRMCPTRRLSPSGRRFALEGYLLSCTSPRGQGDAATYYIMRRGILHYVRGVARKYRPIFLVAAALEKQNNTK